MWNAKQELTKKAVELAKDKHPKGFNKSQLIDASKEVYGGFGAEVLSPFGRKIKTMDDVSNMGNAMSEIDGHYPRGMSGCMVVGMNGGCGTECPVYLGGDCENPEEMELSIDEEELHAELYGE